MEFAPQRMTPRRYGNIAVVVLLHVGLVYVFSKGLMNHILPTKHVPDAQYVEPVTKPVKQEWIKPETKQVDIARSIDIPKIIDDLSPPRTDKIEPPQQVIDPNAGQLNQSVDTGAVDNSVAVIDHATKTSADPGVMCNNYGAIQSWLSERFPVIADREGFADRGITHFDMTVQLTVGPNGEVRNPVVRDASNSAASRAMQSTVFAGMLQLKCVGAGHDVSMNVPLSFTLTD